MQLFHSQLIDWQACIADGAHACATLSLPVMVPVALVAAAASQMTHRRNSLCASNFCLAVLCEDATCRHLLSALLRHS